MAVLCAGVSGGPAFGGAVAAGEPGEGDRLVVAVRDSGELGLDGTRELYCHPAGGDHPDAEASCARLDRNTVWGADPFAPVPTGSVCTLQDGGPVTAHVTGWWAGRPVDAVFRRGNGCEIERWERMVPVLPALRTRPDTEHAPTQ